MQKINKNGEFKKIPGVKKVIRCITCGKKVFVKNFNQLKCEKCGYRGELKASSN
jgi:DNA-directed RNA polymerase subunit RPC12/RpoP